MGTDEKDIALIGNVVPTTCLNAEIVVVKPLEGRHPRFDNLGIAIAEGPSLIGTGAAQLDHLPRWFGQLSLWAGLSIRIVLLRRAS